MGLRHSWKTLEGGMSRSPFTWGSSVRKNLGSRSLAVEHHTDERSLSDD